MIRLPDSPAYHLLCCVLWLLFATTASADKAPVTPANSAEKHYLQSIDTGLRKLKVATAHRTALASRLDDIRGQINNISSQENAITLANATMHDSLAQFQARISTAETAIQDRTDALRRSRSALSSLPPPTLLATALQKPSVELQRRKIAVQHYLIHKAERRVDEAVSHKHELISNKALLTHTSRNLNSSMEELISTRQDLLDKRQSLEMEFTHLSANIVKQQDRIDSLQTRLTEIREIADSLVFTAQRGKLPDPTPGKLKHRFAEPKAQGLLTWDGILVEAPNDQPFSAVFDGKVVFADHLQGLGNVAIVDHGEGYMSLYGMADFLVVETDQLVLSGDMLGTVGQAVGKPGSRLYFEIRHNATTLNPQDWLAMTKISPN